ncbi:DUF4185 domain-containing protein [Corynebacterium mayonis]|uniref:DUF4185 domain-containing protein n=1 Tax=Corynebacterium mayonis TaxID=3062461 RepID=UPI00314017EE
MRLRPLALTAALTVTLTPGVASPVADAQSSLSSLSSASSLSSLSSGSSGGGRQKDPSPIQDAPGTPIAMPGDIIVQIMGDLLGNNKSDHVGFKAGDLGIMTPLGNGEEFAIIFGDSFRGNTLGQGEWMSPVGVVARMVDGVIKIIRPLNIGEKVNPLIRYFRAEGDNLTLIPSDVLNIDGTLYMQGMWNRGIGNVEYTEIWKSTDNGTSWASVGKTSSSYMNGLGNLISWERGDDGYIYAVSSSFKRDHPVFLSRFRENHMNDRSKWELFNPATGSWSSAGNPILSGNVEAGEMNLRLIDGHWVLVMFNEATLQIEVRISDTLARDWNDVPVAVIAKHGLWSNEQTPANFSQPYGGYIVPGSTLANMDIVVSQWNTSTNRRYNSTQFNVKGLDAFFGVRAVNRSMLRSVPFSATEPGELQVTKLPGTSTPEQAAEDAALSHTAP